MKTRIKISNKSGYCWNIRVQHKILGLWVSDPDRSVSISRPEVLGGTSYVNEHLNMLDRVYKMSEGETPLIVSPEVSHIINITTK